MKKLSAFLLFLFVVVGCTAVATKLGLEPPDTTPQRLAYAYTTLAEIRETTTHLLQVKRLDVATARQVQDLADVTRLSLDQARGAAYSATPNPNVALKSLETAEALLGQLQNLIATRQKRP